MVRWTLIVISLQIFITQCQNTDGPTLKPADPFSASEDAQVIIKQLFNNNNPDIDAFLKLWFHRTFAQRTEIEGAYNKTETGSKNDLYDFLHSNFKHKTAFLNMFSDSLLPPQKILAYIINSVVNDHLDEPVGAIEEVVCGSDQDMKDKIAECYSTVVTDGEKNVDDALKGFRKHKHPKYNKFLYNYCWIGRKPCQGQKIKPEEVEKEAKALKDAENEKDHFLNQTNYLLDTYCEYDLSMIFQKYRMNRNDGSGINNEVQKATSDDERLRRAYDYLVRKTEDSYNFFAEELGKALTLEKPINEDGSRNTDKISRIVLIRSEIDLGHIMKSFDDKYKKPFTDYFQEDTVAYKYNSTVRYLCGMP